MCSILGDYVVLYILYKKIDIEHVLNKIKY